jgi:hypothetical protein
MDTSQKRKRIQELRAYHEPIFRKMNCIDPLFIPRTAYKPVNHSEICISFFASELRNEKDIYTEFVSKKYDIEDSQRTLWKWKYDPEWKKYIKSNDVIPSAVQYFIPTSKLIVVSRNNELIFNKDKVNDFKSNITTVLKPKTNDANKEELISQMTIKDFAAIIWKQPVSDKEWLNILIDSIE